MWARWHRCEPCDRTVPPFDLPPILLRVEGERYRFLPNGKSIVYMQGFLPSQDFWLLDLDTKASRALTRLSGGAAMRTFDITPDGKRIVFDRLRENSDIVLIDLARRSADNVVFPRRPREAW